MLGPMPSPSGFTDRFARVNGVRLHYVIGGKGSPVVLLHGYAETGHMWRPIMPLLAQRHTVIVPDLRGAGGSAKPPTGYHKKNMAVDIHELTSSLKFDRVSIVGHDIGLMVAYAYAAQYPTEVESIVLMDAFLPGVQAVVVPGIGVAACRDTAGAATAGRLQRRRQDLGRRRGRGPVRRPEPVRVLDRHRTDRCLLR